jgi:hypothetical protein
MTQLGSQVDGKRRNSRQITARGAVHDLCCGGYAASPLNYELAQLAQNRGSGSGKSMP